MPLGLLLLYFVEITGAEPWLVHALGMITTFTPLTVAALWLLSAFL